MVCPHRQDGNCAIAAGLANERQVQVCTDAACAACEQTTTPRARNKVTCDLAVAALRALHRADDAVAVMAAAPDLYGGQSSATPLPSWARQAWSLATAVAGYVAGGFALVAEDVYAARLAACDACKHRHEHRCRLCGCFVRAKAALPKERCPAQPPQWESAISNLKSEISNPKSEISNLKSEISNLESAIDILIPVGRGSRHDDLELRYALRSLASHARGVRRIWIIGRIPAWLHQTDQVRLVPRDEIRANKASRISAKVEWACRELTEMTEHFAFWNDDFLLTKPLDVRTIPAWYHGELLRDLDATGWQRLLHHTGEALLAAGRPAKHYDIHVPMLLEKRKYLALATWWERSRREGGYTMKSVYGNHFCDGVAVSYTDGKLADKWPSRIDQIIADRPVISYGNDALKAGFGCWMRSAFPDAHPAERTVVAVLGQFRAGTSCVSGVLHTLGVPMGSGWPRRPRSNPHGTFEDRALARLCRRAFPEPQLTGTMPAAKLTNRLRRYLRRRDNEGPIVGVKHPSLCLCIPQMLAVWGNVRLIAVDRPAAESVASMARAMWGWTPQQATAGVARLIATRDREIERLANTVPVLRVSYHQLLADPAATVAGIVQFLGIEPDETQIQTAIASVDPALRTIHPAAAEAAADR